MLGGSNCKVGGKKNKKKTKSGGSSCGSRLTTGGKKVGRKVVNKAVKKDVKKAVKKKVRGGGFCIGNLAPFDDSANSSGGSVPSSTQAPSVAPAPAPVPVEAPTQVPPQPSIMGGNEMFGGAKKSKSRKAGPYAKFVKKHFASVQKKNPKFKATDCIKEIAKMWKSQKK